MSECAAIQKYYDNTQTSNTHTTHTWICPFNQLSIIWSSMIHSLQFECLHCMCAIPNDLFVEQLNRIKALYNTKSNSNTRNSNKIWRNKMFLIKNSQEINKNNRKTNSKWKWKSQNLFEKHPNTPEWYGMCVILLCKKEWIDACNQKKKLRTVSALTFENIGEKSVCLM